jgi:hypothetical protein
VAGAVRAEIAASLTIVTIRDRKLCFGGLHFRPAGGISVITVINRVGGDTDMTRKYIGIVETAKIIRVELKRAFPASKFSVRSQQYSMGSHIWISWTDGPSTKAVETITDQFYGTGFDGMTDSTTHHDSQYRGETVHFAGSRPSCSREISPAYEANCAKAWEALDGGERCNLLNRPDFPRWPEDRPGHRLACWLSA